MTAYLNMPSLFARTVMIVVALISVCGFAHSTSSQTKGDQDGPVSVKYGDLFKSGELKIEAFGLADLPPFPAGYDALNNKAFRITTTAIAAGYTIRFAVPSVTDEDVFKKLRIFHVDYDPYDPDAYIWRDVTVLESATESPRFSTKTIYGTSESLGVFVIAKLVREVANNAIADLVVTTSGAADRLTAPSLITYTIKVHNQGPDNATDVALWDGQAGSADLVSVEPSQGKCKPSGGHIVCRLGSLKAGESITIAVKLKPYEGRGSFPKEGKEISHRAGAGAPEKDPNLQNNEASDRVLVFPDPNQLPTVFMKRPGQGERFIGPADVTLEAVAEDADGSISKVEFFDNNKSLGLGTSGDGKNFVLTARGLAYGNHLFVAVATDNGGRIDWSVSRGVFVNGLANVSLKSPTEGSLIAPGPDLTLTAVASHPSGVIDKVQFFSHDRLLGEGTLTGQHTYSFTWKGDKRGTHSVAVIAIDGSGIPTLSATVKFTLDIPPEVVITSPPDSARFTASTNVRITATAKDAWGAISNVDFYANDHLIGRAWNTGTGKFSFTWRNVPEGQYTLKAVVVNEAQVSGTSKPVTVRIENPNKRP